MTTSTALIVLGSVIFWTAQLFNLLRRSYRLGSGVVGLLALAGAMTQPGFDWAQVLFWSVAGVLILGSKWHVEIETDQLGREDEGLPPLVAARSAWRTSWFLLSAFRYRCLMFKDEHSKRSLLARLVKLPRSLRDPAVEVSALRRLEAGESEADGLGG